MRQQARALKEIMKLPLSKRRLALGMAYQSKRFAAADFENFVVAISGNEHVQKELPRVREALKTGHIKGDANIVQPETQLLWAATLVYLEVNPDHIKTWPAEKQAEKLSGTPFWKELTTGKYAKKELIKNAFHIAEAVRNPDTRMGWGEAGSWFWFNPANNKINIDFMYSLLTGFEHARSVVFHEIGHSQLTVAWPESMQKIHKRMEEIQKKAKKEKLSRDEYIELNVLSAEWNMRHQLFNPMEDNTVNRYAANMGEILAQDYGYSLNHISASIAGTGMIANNQAAKAEAEKKAKAAGQDPKAAANGNQPPMDKKQKELAEKQEKFRNICHAVNMSFFQNNGLFKNSPEGWAEVDVKPQWLTGDDKMSVAKALKDKKWTNLRKMLGMDKGFEGLQPDDGDRLFGKSYFDALVDDYSEKRNKIYEKIWDEYCEHLARPLLEQVKEQVEEQLDNPQDENSQDGQDQDGQEQDGQDQDGQGQPGEGQPGQGQPGEGQPGQGGEQGEQGDPIEVDGHGEQPNVEMPPEDPSAAGADDDAELDPDADADGAGGGDSDDDENDQTIEDLTKGDDSLDEDADADGQDADADGQDADGQQPGQGDGEGDGEGDDAGKGKGKGGKTKKSLDDLAKGDWTDYQSRIAELSGPIAQVSQMLKKIQEHQLETVKKRSKNKEIIPQDGEVDRLDLDAHIELQKKKRTGQKIEERDLERFKIDKNVTQPTKVELVILIDGSGSMSWNAGGGATNLELALQSAAIMYEAGRRVGVDVYIGMWGNDKPPMLAKPGDDPKKIGAAFEGMRRSKGLNSGTQLAPAIKGAVKAMSEARRKLGQPTGFSHLVVISDGDIQDVAPSRRMVETLFRESARATVDFGIIGQRQTSLDDVAKRTKNKRAVQKIGSVHELEASKVTTSVIGLILQKIRAGKSFAAVSNYSKRSQMKRATRKMDRKP